MAQPPEKPAPRRPGQRTSAAGPTRPRGGPARAIADIVPDIGRTAFRRFGFVQSSVVTRWPEIVGEAHARVSAPQAIRFPFGKAGVGAGVGAGVASRTDGVLELTVEGAHAPLIAHIVPEIIERVNRFFGYAAVARVKIRQGTIQPRPPARAAAPMLRPAPIELGDSLRDVGDAELGAVLASLAHSLSNNQQG